MALIIGVGHGHLTDPFTFSTSSEDTDDLSKVEDCLERLRANQFPDATTETIQSWVDEILVVENDDVIHHYSWENGLGAPSPEVGEAEDASDFPDFQEQEDDSDSEEV